MLKKCQVFTPAQNVKELLDSVGYISNLNGKKVVENACGDGNILKEIVKRYIEDAIKNNRTIDDIRKGLQLDIHGAEICYEQYTNCLANLDSVADSYKISNVKWNIFNGDFLKQQIENKFDYVIGNPPYITYRELDDLTRAYLSEKFTSCRHGMFDYCYAFIESSLSCLKDTGKLAYLIPSSIFKNVFAQELRNMILPSTLKIIDYTTQKLFEKTLTSSAILVCDMGMLSQNIEYQDVANGTTKMISKDNLYGKWVFSERKCYSKSKKKFGDFFTAAISIATLLNEAYIIKDFSEEGEYYLVDNYKIERNVARKGVSPRSLKYKKEELIIFPYSYEKSVLVRYKSKEFEGKFPEATKYLKSFANKLIQRKSDKSVEWFEYGRTQAISHLNQTKLLLSTVVTNEVNVYELNKDCIPYSGIYIVPKT